MNKIKFTIAIPVFNRKQYILESINSVLNQQIDNCELIICDNASSDGTWEILKSLNNENIKIFRNNHNIGMVANWVRCIEEANGEWFKFLMSDDIFLKGSLTTIDLLVDMFPNSVIISKGLYFNKRFKKKISEEEIKYRVISSDQELKQRKKFNFWYSNPNSYTVKTKILKDVIKTEEFQRLLSKYNTTGHGMDYYLLQASVRKVNQVIHLYQDTYATRVHVGNASRDMENRLLFHLSGDRDINFSLFTYTKWEYIYLYIHSIKTFINSLYTCKSKKQNIKDMLTFIIKTMRCDWVRS